MNRYWSAHCWTLDPYVPGEQPQDQQYIKLNTNESPYPPSPAVAEACAISSAQACAAIPTRKVRLVTALAEYHGLSSQQVFVGNGSDEVLAHAFQALLQKPAADSVPRHQLQLLPGLLQPLPNRIRNRRAGPGFWYRHSRLSARQWRDRHPQSKRPHRHRTGTRCNPAVTRAPSRVGSHHRRSLRRFRRRIGAIADCRPFDNLLVVQTFSKSRSLAGLRLGAAFGHRR